MKLSIIIPTLDEGESIEKLVRYCFAHKNVHDIEVIVADAGSKDDTVPKALSAGAIIIQCPEKGRSAQMNFSAQFANGDVLYFVHADSFPPTSFAIDISKAINNGYALGRYRTKFDTSSLLLKLNAFFTRFDLFMCYGGDQTLFIQKKLFDCIEGFDQKMLILEEYDLVERARQKGKYKIFPGKALISTRKYKMNSWLRVQKANYKVFQMYKKGVPQADIVATYKNMLDYR
ncbi:MAG: TIGR04283 family arsenosugar biosynthesis glycosyltransferase [Chitinophagaceae bacterium]